MHGMQTHSDLVAIQGYPLDRGCIHWTWLPDIPYLGSLVFVFKPFQVTMVPTSSFGLTPGQLLPALPGACRHWSCDPARSLTSCCDCSGWGLVCHLPVTPSLPKVGVKAPSAPCHPHTTFTDTALRLGEGRNLLRVPTMMATLGPAGKYLLFKSGAVCLRTGQREV